MPELFGANNTSRPDTDDAPNPERYRDAGADILTAILLAFGIRLGPYFDISSVMISVILNRLIEHQSQEMVAATRQLNEGRLTLRQWLIKMRDLMYSYGYAGAMARTGGHHLDGVAFEAWSSEMALQYGYLARYRGQIADGAQLLGLGTIARSDLYARALWATTTRVWSKVRADQLLEAHRGEDGGLYAIRTRAIADSCNGCIVEANRGWVPIEDHTPIGSTECGSRCLCDLRIEWFPGIVNP